MRRGRVDRCEFLPVDRSSVCDVCSVQSGEENSGRVVMMCTHGEEESVRSDWYVH